MIKILQFTIGLICLAALAVGFWLVGKAACYWPSDGRLIYDECVNNSPTLMIVGALVLLFLVFFSVIGYAMIMAIGHRVLVWIEERRWR